MPYGTTDNPLDSRTGPAAELPDALQREKIAEQPLERSPRKFRPAKPRRSKLNDARGLAATWVLNLLLAGLAFTLTLPFLWMVLASVSPLNEVGTGSWIPTGFRFENYAEVFAEIPFARFFANSLFIATAVTFLKVFTSALAAFAFARLDWPGRDKVFLLYLSTMMLPGLVMMIPNYQIMITLGLVDTMLGLILPAAFTAFGTFLLRQFMLTIPKSLDEAAELDGASLWRTFWDVILPLSRSGLIVLVIFTFIQTYHSFFWPLVMLRSEHKYTLPIGLLAFDTASGQATHLLMAAVTMSIIPLILVFVLLQRYLVKGIQLGAVKG